MKNTKKEQDTDLPILNGQISLEDILESADDGTYGKPLDTFEVQS